MTENKVGFTLVELLVVVLIIGVLASIALPEYQKAVEKARATEAVVLASSFMKQADLKFLEGWPETDISSEEEIFKILDLPFASSKFDVYAYYSKGWTSQWHSQKPYVHFAIWPNFRKKRPNWRIEVKRELGAPEWSKLCVWKQKNGEIVCKALERTAGYEILGIDHEGCFLYL